LIWQTNPGKLWTVEKRERKPDGRLGGGPMQKKKPTADGRGCGPRVKTEIWEKRKQLVEKEKNRNGRETLKLPDQINIKRLRCDRVQDAGNQKKNGDNSLGAAKSAPRNTFFKTRGNGL